MAARTPFATLLEARSTMAVDLRPDGEEVLVASNLSGTMQLYTVPVEGGEWRQLTRFAEPVTLGRYVPGTADIALQVDTGGNERYQIKLIRQDGTGLRDLVVDPDVMHILGAVSADGRRLGYVCNRRNRVDFDVYVRDLGSGEERCVMEGGGWNRAASFSPDGRWLAVVRAGELALNSDIHLIDLEGGETVHVTPHQGSVGNVNPSWYPDSRRLLFSTDQDREFFVIARYDLEGRGWEVVAEPGWDAYAWVAAGGATVLVASNEDGVTRLRLHDPETLERVAPVSLPQPGVAVESASTPEPRLSADGSRVLLTFTCTSEPADVWLHDVATRSLSRVTRSPSEIPAELGLPPERHRVRAQDGTELPVFLYRPPAPADGAPAPAVLFIHGGPESQFVPTFNPVILHLVDCGYAVVAPNVRGSTGYGKTYAHMDDVRLRLDSVADLAAIHEWLPGVGLDRDRAALMGGSYGGYMVLAGLAFQPERWAAGVSIVGISSLVTFLENTSPYRRHLREVEYGSLEYDRDFLIEASPLTHVERIRVPLLLVHGSNDPRVPLSEAEQIHTVLGERGVPCELLVYPDEGHGLARLPNRLDAYPKISDFLQRMLRAPAPA